MALADAVDPTIDFKFTSGDILILAEDTAKDEGDGMFDDAPIVNKTNFKTIIQYGVKLVDIDGREFFSSSTLDLLLTSPVAKRIINNFPQFVNKLSTRQWAKIGRAIIE